MHGNMVADTAEIPARSRQSHPVLGGRIGKLDGRSQAARRTKRLVAEYLAALGDREAAGAAMLATVKRAAELVTVAELTRIRAMRGDAVLDDLVRIERLAELAVRRLGLDRRKREPAAAPLRERLAREAVR